MKKVQLKLKIVVFVLFSIVSFAQIKITQLPPTNLSQKDLAPDGISDYRNFILLDGNWNVYKSEEPGKKKSVKLPLVFQNAEGLVFEKSFQLNKDVLKKNLRLTVYGLNYSAEIVLNDVPVYRHTGGNIPLSFFLPPNVLNDGSNTLKIKVKGELDSRNTLPVSQRFLFPKHRGGIRGDVLLEVLPTFALTNFQLETKQNNAKKSAQVFASLNLVESKTKDSLSLRDFALNFRIFDESGTLLKSKEFKYSKAAESLHFSVNLNNVEFWTPQKPALYYAEVSLLVNGEPTDKIKKEFSIFEITHGKEGIFLNGKKIYFAGTIYSEPDIDVLSSDFYNAVKKDLTLIKESGFNSVRFKFNYPQPFELNICRKIGLIPFVEIPLQNPPTEFFSDKSYTNRVLEILNSVQSYYSNFENVKILGLGSSFLNSDEETRSFITKFSESVPDKRFLKFASFADFPTFGIKGLALYGTEIYAKDFNTYFDSLHASPLSNSIFISEISYPRIYGHTNGYLNQYSVEAQAKYFTNLINRTRREETNGFVINSIFDYRGDFTSFYAGYHKKNIYKIGLTDESRNVNSLSLRAVKQKLLNGKEEKILLGTKKNRSPIFFILAGLILGIVMGLLFNSKRSFREEATRSLLRPYNFFADIRDHRILSGFHTFVLMLVLTGIHALLISIILFFLRMNILLEKILISFNAPSLTKTFSYLAWHPVSAFFILWVVSIFLFLFLAGIIKTSSIFVKQKVFFSNIYFVVIWAFLPLTILLPLELVLHKILLANVVNIYVYLLLLFFLIWTIKRLFMGIYIIFDVTPQAVYFWGFLFILLVLGVTIVYFQATHDTLYYIFTALKEHPLI